MGKVYKRIGKSHVFLWKVRTSDYFCKIVEGDLLVVLSAPTETGTRVLYQNGTIGELAQSTSADDFAEIAL